MDHQAVDGRAALGGGPQFLNLAVLQELPHRCVERVEIGLDRRSHIGMFLRRVDLDVRDRQRLSLDLNLVPGRQPGTEIIARPIPPSRIVAMFFIVLSSF